MFTGLVRWLGTIKDATPFGKGRRLTIVFPTPPAGVAIGQSVAVNGACLTVTAIHDREATFEAVSETVSRTNLAALRAGDRVNLEPALKAGDALDGHMVLGHVDAMGRVLAVDAANPDSRTLKISLPEAIRALVAEKGSVAIDGISLTVAAAGADWFTVAVIPLTWENTTLCARNVGDGVNLEADVLARYAARILQYGDGKTGGLSEEFLRKHGFGK